MFKYYQLKEYESNHRVENKMRRSSKTLRDLFGKEKSLKEFLLIEHKIKEGGILEFTNHPFFTSHGIKHVAFVENVVDSLLPLNIKKEMNPLEVSILLLSILLHDIGMIPESNETLKNIREVHNIRTREIINKYYPEISIDKIQAEIIGDICYAHRDHLLDGIKFNTLDEIKKRPYQINLVKIRGNFLASLIRLADELDITYSRAPEFIQKVAKPDESHKEHWDTHNLIAGIDIDSSQWKIKKLN